MFPGRDPSGLGALVEVLLVPRGGEGADVTAESALAVKDDLGGTDVGIGLGIRLVRGGRELDPEPLLGPHDRRGKRVPVRGECGIRVGLVFARDQASDAGLNHLEIKEAREAELPTQGDPAINCRASSPKSHHHPVSRATRLTAPTVVWLKRGARASMTSVSPYGSAVRTDTEATFTSHHIPGAISPICTRRIDQSGGADKSGFPARRWL